MSIGSSEERVVYGDPTLTLYAMGQTSFQDPTQFSPCKGEMRHKSITFEFCFAKPSPKSLQILIL
ncbi:MAG: hypothetical protein LBU14_05675 [Candidatus Peribacteria bacterium]|nr:hypothetical protein [Candidatus Peribacteria bacterium]